MKVGAKKKKKEKDNTRDFGLCISLSFFGFMLHIQERRLVILNGKFSSVEKGFQEERKTKGNGTAIKSCPVQRSTCRHCADKIQDVGH